MLFVATFFLLLARATRTFFNLINREDMLITPKITHSSKNISKPIPALIQTLKNGEKTYFSTPNSHFEIRLAGMQNTVINVSGFNSRPPTFVFLFIK